MLLCKRMTSKRWSVELEESKWIFLDCLPAKVSAMNCFSSKAPTQLRPSVAFKQRKVRKRLELCDEEKKELKGQGCVFITDGWLHFLKTGNNKRLLPEL